MKLATICNFVCGSAKLFAFSGITSRDEVSIIHDHFGALIECTRPAGRQCTEGWRGHSESQCADLEGAKKGGFVSAGEVFAGEGLEIGWGARDGGVGDGDDLGAGVAAGAEVDGCGVIMAVLEGEIGADVFTGGERDGVVTEVDGG